ncbi:MAG: glucuronate isomerase [Bacteroidota bacterium]|nr:glucuronate isomerase [Bacteroidota bacterium]
MKNFLDKNFLLQNKTSERLYHEYAGDLPIIDYHCHLPVEDIANNRMFNDLTEVWLEGDHYKWRAMRANGIPEKYCTGDESSGWEKFEKWAETVPYTIRNPLYHWTHLELRRYFGINDLLSQKTARKIFDEANKKLHDSSHSSRGLMQQMNVELVCTTDDPIDSLKHHKKLESESFGTKVLPAFRPDKAMAVEEPGSYNKYLDRLGEVAGLEIRSYEDLIQALKSRHDFFGKMGCRLSDHGIETFYAEEYTEGEVKDIFIKVRSGKILMEREIRKIKSAMLFELAIMDHEKGWVQQFHYGVIRNNNLMMFNKLGPDSGYDSIGSEPVARNMSKFLDRLASRDKLTKTIIYNINPADNELVATMVSNFQDGSVPGKMQFGSGWWFLDQKDGIERQINALSNMGLLSRFVGMLTDSRSFLSYPRHEYFRRILCNIIGTDVENGLLPDDSNLLGKMVQDISYFNAKNYFKFS